MSKTFISIMLATFLTVLSGWGEGWSVYQRHTVWLLFTLAIQSYWLIDNRKATQ